MKLQNKVVRGIALVMCTFVLVYGIATSYAIPVYAAESAKESPWSVTKIIDMILSATGVALDKMGIDELCEIIDDELDAESNSYSSYLTSNELEDTYNNYVDWVKTDSTAPEWLKTFRLSDFARNVCFNDDGSSKIPYRKYSLYDYVNYCLGTGDIVDDSNYIINDAVMDLVDSAFDHYVETQGDYYYVDSLSPENINPLWFTTKDSYENFVSVLKSSKNIMNIYMYHSNGQDKYFSLDSHNVFTSGTVYIYFLNENLGFIRDTSGSDIIIYDTEWNRYDAPYYVIDSNPLTYTSEEEIVNNCSRIYYFYRLQQSTFETTAKYQYLGFCTSDGRKVRIFKTLEAYKLFSVGQQPYYVTNNNYNASGDNSMVFSGDYYVNNSNTYSHDVIQETIDNSENITEENVNSIVDSTINNITNNYYGTSGDNSGNSGNSGGNGLSSLIGGIGDLLDFVLDLLGQVISLLATFLDSTLTLLSGLGSQFSGFAGLLGDLFTFIPQELIDAISAGISLLIAIAIIKALKG